MIFIEVHLPTGKLVPIVMIHPLGGSFAYRHHTPNPQIGCHTTNTKMGIHKQSTRVAFCDVPRRRHKNPSQSP